MHGMIMVIYLLTALFLGGFGNYLIPLDVRVARHGIPVYEYAQCIGCICLSVLILMASFFVPGRANRCRLDAIPAAGDYSRGRLAKTWGIHADAGIVSAVFIIAFTMGGLNYVTTVLQARCRGMTLMRMPLVRSGVFSWPRYWACWHSPRCWSVRS